MEIARHDLRSLRGRRRRRSRTSLVKLKTRLELSRAKHRSLGRPRAHVAPLAALVPFYEYDEAQFFRADDAPGRVAARRRAGFMRLADALPRALSRDRSGAPPRSPTASPTCSSPTPTACRSSSAASCASTCKAGAFVQSSSGVTRHRSRRQRVLRSHRLLRRQPVRLRLLQGHASTRGAERVRELGPVLGAYHPVVADNVRRLREISGLDEVSFHMSGTEAVMQAVRLARYHTRRSHLVRFCGAYHGWWGDVQPGVGNPVPARETYTLNDMSERDAARAAHAGATSPACWSIRCRRCIRTRARRPTRRWSTAAAQRAFRPRGLCRMAASSCARSAASAASC